MRVSPSGQSVGLAARQMQQHTLQRVTISPSSAARRGAHRWASPSKAAPSGKYEHRVAPSIMAHKYRPAPTVDVPHGTAIAATRSEFGCHQRLLNHHTLSTSHRLLNHSPTVSWWRDPPSSDDNSWQPADSRAQTTAGVLPNPTSGPVLFFHSTRRASPNASKHRTPRREKQPPPPVMRRPPSQPQLPAPANAPTGTPYPSRTPSSTPTKAPIHMPSGRGHQAAVEADSRRTSVQSDAAVQGAALQELGAWMAHSRVQSSHTMPMLTPHTVPMLTPNSMPMLSPDVIPTTLSHARSSHHTYARSSHYTHARISPRARPRA